MNSKPGPFAHHPELEDKITDPLTSFFRTFRVESMLENHPELEWLGELLHSDEVREKNRLEALGDYPDKDLWVFAYGSLMWDPAFRFSEVRRARVPDYERRFILKDIYGGRGDRETPGLMAALDHGTGCDGLIFRIPREIMDIETEILWRRELVAPTYIPSFVTALVNNQPIKVLTFTADHDAHQICADISREEQIKHITTGHGILGASMDYLANIVTQFDVLGIVDDECSSLLAEAQEHLRRNQA
jgi:cation transport protein ChaC